MKFPFFKILLSLFLGSALIVGGCSSSLNTTEEQENNNERYSWLNLDTVKAGRFDTGRMWTFEHPPLDYFQEEYQFAPTNIWLDNVRLSALRFANYCSASFVSEDGLVMTNNHCARESVVEVSQEGEDLLANGFYAESLEEERRIPALYVDQLVLIKDVTDEIQSRLKGLDGTELLIKEDEILNEMEASEKEKTGLKIQITPLYDGGRYSLYGYKRYNDVRLVFSPEHQLGHFGGDYDNFTYPRYNLDVSFFRVYDEQGNPLKTDNFLKWSEKGPAAGEAVFVVGNPGSTHRLKTVSQLQYMRDVKYPRTLEFLKGMIEVYAQLIEDDPEKKGELEVQLLRYLNSQKAYGGMLAGLRDPILMAKKRDFEQNFKNAVQSNSDLNKDYGDIWEKLEGIQDELKDISNELYVLTLTPSRTSTYFYIAGDLIELADQMKLPSDQRDEMYTGDELQVTINNIYPPDLDIKYHKTLLQKQIKIMSEYLGKDAELVKKLTGGRDPEQAAEYLINNSVIADEIKVKALIDKGPDAILNSDDPFIYFILNSYDRQYQLQQRSNELNTKETVYNQQLGRALFEVYGNSIPPDATFTLRITDGVVKGYDYNGTAAPPITTFYGLYDRYYSFNKEYPFDLPAKWINPPADFELEVPFNFVSTNDIIGGNSGSPVINKNAEIVGIAFDGNMESLPGSFIFDEEKNRTVSVHSEGMIEALSDLYLAKRLTEELKNGKLRSNELSITK